MPKYISFADLKIETEKLLRLLQKRQPGDMLWNDNFEEAIRNIHELVNPVFQFTPEPKYQDESKTKLILHEDKELVVTKTSKGEIGVEDKKLGANITIKSDPNGLGFNTDGRVTGVSLGCAGIVAFITPHG